MNKTGTGASVAAFVAKPIRQQLYDLRYTKGDVDSMKPDQALATLKLHDLGYSKAAIAAMTPDQARVFLSALEYVASGLSLIPIGPNSKNPPEKLCWKKYQSKRPTDAELYDWVSKYPGLGITGGKVSGNNGDALEILDLESIAPLDEFRQLAEEAAPGLLEQLPRTKTPTDGRHIYYRCATVEGNQKLAQRAEEIGDTNLPLTGDGALDLEAIKKLGLRKTGNKYFKIRTLIETRGEGGQVLSPLCLPGTHPNGGVYELINGDLRNIPTITSGERDVLLTAARACNEFIEPAKAKGCREADREKVEGLKPGADYNARSDAVEKVRTLLEEYGWTLFRRDSLGELWSRPGVTDHCSARLFNDGALYVFSTNASPFNAGETYTPFGIYAELKHDSNYHRAAKALATGGYGAQRQRSKMPVQSVNTPATQPGVVAHSLVLERILAKLQPCDFYALGGFKSGSEIKQKYYVVLCVRELLKVVEAQNFALARKNDFIFVYNGEYWREIDRDTLKDFLGNAAERLGVISIEAHHYEFKDKLWKQFLAAAHFEQAEPENGKALVNLKNGTFEITADSQKLRPFDPADFLKYQLPFEYDANAMAPIFTAYLNRVLPELELQNIVSEFFGYVFTRRLKLEKALLLYGIGANGKSVLFDVMNALLGRENTANYSLSDLMQEHNRAQIAHKLLNYGSEINASVTKDVFKNLVSGEAIMARLKYGNSFLMEDYAKLCFNCNELPKDIEQTEAYFRRLLIVPFRVVIPESEQDKELAQKIIAGELSGVFNWVLAGLRRLLKNKKFTASKIVEDAVNDYKRESDSVACFLDESECGSEGLLKDVYRDYKTYCSDSGVKALGKQKFRRRLESHGFEVEKINEGMRISRKQE